MHAECKLSLYGMLIGEKNTDKHIDFYDHISKVKEEAHIWLAGIEKNGINHSERLEDYLNLLIPDDLRNKLKPAEIFILLYAVYLHDIGYLNEKDEIEAYDHPKRSRDYILNNHKKYLLGDFPPRSDGLPSSARAVADVC